MIFNPISAGGGVKLPELTISGTAADLLAPKQLIDADGNVLTGTMPEVEQATPAITINSTGLITASATQTAGYVAEGTKSATKQLTTKAAATITPGTADQTIAAGTYLAGAQTIKGDANLLSSNIRSGVSIFGVAGTAAGMAEIAEGTYRNSTTAATPTSTSALTIYDRSGIHTVSAASSLSADGILVGDIIVVYMSTRTASKITASGGVALIDSNVSSSTNLTTGYYVYEVTGNSFSITLGSGGGVQQ